MLEKWKYFPLPFSSVLRRRIVVKVNFFVFADNITLTKELGPITEITIVVVKPQGPASILGYNISKGQNERASIVDSLFA